MLITLNSNRPRVGARGKWSRPSPRRGVGEGRSDSVVRERGRQLPAVAGDYRPVVPDAAATGRAVVGGAGPSGLLRVTVSIVRRRATVFRPKPRTLRRSSTRVKAPCFFRYATIAAALAGPIPGSATRSGSVASLRSTAPGSGTT